MTWARGWSVPLGVFNYPVCADVDGDGQRELLILATSGHPLCVLGADGKLRWEAQVQTYNPPDGMIYPDLEKDQAGTWRVTGEPIGRGLYYGGALRHNDWGYQAALLDVDGDGRQEVIVGRRGQLLALEGSTGQSVKQWSIPGDIIASGDTIGFFLTLHARGERRLLVPTRMNGAFCLDERMEQVQWRLPLPMPGHWIFAGDVDGDGEQEVLWGYDCTGAVAHRLGVIWLVGADGRVRWRRFSDEIMDDTHLDHALMLPPTSRRQGLIVLPDGPALAADGSEVFNVRRKVHHGQRVALLTGPGGEEVLIYAARGESGCEHALATTGVVAVNTRGQVLWERRDLTRTSGHRVGDVWPVNMGGGGPDLAAVGELGGWQGTPRRGPGEHYVYLLTPGGELVDTIGEYDSGEGGAYTGATGMGFDLDADGRDELYVCTNDGTWSCYRQVS
jgi:hypothetical protein